MDYAIARVGFNRGNKVEGGKRAEKRNRNRGGNAEGKRWNGKIVERKKRTRGYEQMFW